MKTVMKIRKDSGFGYNLHFFILMAIVAFIIGSVCVIVKNHKHSEPKSGTVAVPR